MNNDTFSGTNGGGGLSAELEARVVAWVLGEVSAFEAAELERLCAEQPELAVFKRRLQAVHGLVGEAAKPLKERLRLSAERRAKVLAVIGGGASSVEAMAAAPAKARKRARSWRSWVLPMAACFTLMTLLAGVIIPTVGSVKKKTFSAKFELSESHASEPAEVEHRLQAARKGGGSASGESMEARGDFSYAPATAPGSGLQVGSATGFSQSFPMSAAGGQMNQLSDAHQPNPVAAADGFTARLNKDERASAVAAEVRYRRQIRPQADPFAVPARQELKFKESVREGSNEKALAAKGRSQYLAGDLDGAQETFRTLEAQAPESSEAKSFLGRIREERARVAELNRMKTREQQVEEVALSWNTPGSYKNVSAAPVKRDDLRSRLDKIVIPSVNFAGVELSRVVSTFSSISEEYDGDAKGVDILYDDPEGNPPVTITLRNLSLRRILDLVTESSGYRWEIVDEKVVILPTEETKAARERAKQPVFEEDVRAEIPTTTEAVSTFSLHVSDAAFRVAKAALERGQMPEVATVRPEEFYNAFDYGDPAPVAGEAVSCRVEQAGHPFLQQRNLVRIAMRVPAAGRGAGTPLRLTVLLDTSGSMEREDRAATVRAALAGLTGLLGPNDRVTLVGFARTPRLLAENVAGDQATKLVEVAASTPSEGGTNMEAALGLAGELALRHKLAGAQNRVVLLTDGAANLGNADPQALAKRVEALRQNGIAFDACGVVADGLDDSVLEALTRKGDGRYVVINAPEEADAAFAGKLAGAFRPAAKDVKVQVRFNPARVGRYRLIGFEQHRLKTEDFRNDAVDAAELAAEEAAVALYQVEVLPEGDGELGEVFVRFLDTATNQRVERSWTLSYTAQPAAFARATGSMQLAGSAAFLAEKLRGGALAGQVRLEEFAPVVEGLAGAYPESVRVREFIEMFRQARRMTGE